MEPMHLSDHIATKGNSNLDCKIKWILQFATRHVPMVYLLLKLRTFSSHTLRRNLDPMKLSFMTTLSLTRACFPLDRPLHPCGLN